MTFLKQFISELHASFGAGRTPPPPMDEGSPSISFEIASILVEKEHIQFTKLLHDRGTQKRTRRLNSMCDYVSC